MTRLVSTIGPVVVGVVVAFAWNTAATHQMAGTDAGVTPRVGLTVEQAAAQAWASATPGATTGRSPRASGRARPAGQPRGSVRPADGGCSLERLHPVTVLWSSGSPGHPGQYRTGLHRAGQARGFLRACPRDTGSDR